MRSLIAAIAAALSATGRFVFERVLVAGRWVVRLVSKPGIPMPMKAPVAPDQPEVFDREDEELALVRTVAAHLSANRMPPKDVAERLSEARIAWLAALTPQMLKSVISADKNALSDHLRNRKAITGVLINDPATVERYLQQLDEGEPEPETALTLAA